jgi:hypothetical protein
MIPMDELVVVPLASPGDQLVAQPEFPEPIAEHNFNRKKLCTLEQGLSKLQRSTREQHEVVSQLESGMKAMISETDLRRAIGLAFQEFEHRLEDAFQDSNRKCLAMFSKKDEVNELQATIGKKVNWTEYNIVLKKLSDLRHYLDTMAESIFIGHREALNQEFAKKADREVVDQALRTKAARDEVNEVRARLERLEVLVAHTDAKLSAKIDSQSQSSADHAKQEAENQLSSIAENISAIDALRNETLALSRRIESGEGERASLAERTNKLRENQVEMKRNQDTLILPFVNSAQERMSKTVAAGEQLQQELQAIANESRAFQAALQEKTDGLTATSNTCREQLEFLMQETDMVKRRSRESSKSNAGKFKELSVEDEKLMEQIAILERQVKTSERELRMLFNRQAGRTQDGGGPLQALPAPPEPLDGNDRLRGVLEQLEKIATAVPAPKQQEKLYYEQAFNAQRPPLPLCTGQTAQELAAHLDAASSSPIDSARSGGPPTAAAVKGMYGLSPRSAALPSVKTARKKR